MLSAMLRKLTSIQFSKFLLAGGIAAGANFLSRFAFSLLFPYAIAIVLAFVVGLATGFLLMRTFVFSARGQSPRRQALSFVAVNMAGLGVTLAVSICVSKLVALVSPHSQQLNDAIGHLAGITAPVLMSYHAHKHVTFV